MKNDARFAVGDSEGVILQRKKLEEQELIADITKHMQTQRAKRNLCTGCGAAYDDTQISDGFLVCNECGLVKDVLIDSQAEWRCFNTSTGAKDVSGVRCGDTASNILPGTQLNTYFGKSSKLQRIHQWNNLTPRERNLHQIYKEFEQIGSSHALPKPVVLAATELYNKLYTEMENKNCGVKRCNVRHGLKAACLYFACKQLETPRERKEIAEMVGNTTKIVTKGCNSFLDIMGEEFIQMEPFKPEDFVTRFSLLVGFPYSIQLKLKNLVLYVSALESLADNTPTSVTSACIYFISQEMKLGITKEAIHRKCGSSNVIITKTYGKITPYREELLRFL